MSSVSTSTSAAGSGGSGSGSGLAAAGGGGAGGGAFGCSRSASIASTSSWVLATGCRWWRRCRRRRRSLNRRWRSGLGGFAATVVVSDNASDGGQNLLHRGLLGLCRLAHWHTFPSAVLVSEPQIRFSLPAQARIIDHSLYTPEAYGIGRLKTRNAAINCGHWSEKKGRGTWGGERSRRSSCGGFEVRHIACSESGNEFQIQNRTRIKKLLVSFNSDICSRACSSGMQMSELNH